MDITELLAFSAKQGASDLHLSAGLPPMIRVDGDVRRIHKPFVAGIAAQVWQTAVIHLHAVNQNPALEPAIQTGAAVIGFPAREHPA